MACCDLYVNGKQACNQPFVIGTLTLNKGNTITNTTAGTVACNATTLSLTGATSTISTGTGDLVLLPVAGKIVQIGDAGSTSLSTPTNDDLFVSGRIEVDGASKFDGTIWLNGAVTLTSSSPMDASGPITFKASPIVPSGSMIKFGLNTVDRTFGIYTPTIQDQGVLFIVGNTNGYGNRCISIIDYDSYAKDTDHDTLQSHPTLFVHSVLNPDTDNGEYVGITYAGQTCGTMETDRATWNYTIKAASANSGASTNKNPGDLILSAGDAASGGTAGAVRTSSTLATNAAASGAGTTADPSIRNHIRMENTNTNMHLKCARVIKAYGSDLTDAVDTVDSATVWTQPALTQLLAVKMRLDTQYAATSLTDLDITLGDAGDNDGLLAFSGNLTSDAAGTEYKAQGAYFGTTAAGATAIQNCGLWAPSAVTWVGYATAAGANLSTLSAGQVSFYFYYFDLNA